MSTREVFWCDCGYIPHQIVLKHDPVDPWDVGYVLVQIPPMSWRDRMRAVWRILRGHHEDVAEVVLNRDEATRLWDAIAVMIQDWDRVQQQTGQNDAS